MMEKSNNIWYALSNLAILEKLGEFIQQTRLLENKTQQEIALAAGINRSTLVQLEKGGGGTLLTLISVLRALGQLQLLKEFEVRQQLSPLLLAKLEQKKRKRARNKQSKPVSNSKSEW
jgi:transcriptional regulator with XRE-family HTH domain